MERCLDAGLEVVTADLMADDELVVVNPTFILGPTEFAAHLPA